MSVYGSTSSMTVPLDRGVHATENSVGTEQTMWIRYYAMEVVVRPLQACKLKKLVLNSQELTV